MSKLSLLIKEAKIVNSEYSKPEKQFDQKTGEFKCFNFNIVPMISVKKPKSDEWDSKMLPIRCTMWNEKQADKFLNSFDQAVKNYITVLDGQLTNFHVEKLTKIGQNGNEYPLDTYTYFNLVVNDFIITHREIDEERDSIKKDNPQVIKQQNNDKEESLDDDIPF